MEPLKTDCVVRRISVHGMSLDPQAASLERARLARMHAAATVVQAHVRGRVVQQWYMVVRWAVVTIQVRAGKARGACHEAVCRACHHRSPCAGCCGTPHPHPLFDRGVRSDGGMCDTYALSCCPRTAEPFSRVGNACARHVTLAQASARGMLARRLAERLRRDRAAQCIQAAWRGCAERLRFERMRRSAVVLQAAWRGARVRRQLQDMRRCVRASGPYCTQGLGHFPMCVLMARAVWATPHPANAL